MIMFKGLFCKMLLAIFILCTVCFLFCAYRYASDSATQKSVRISLTMLNGLGDLNSIDAMPTPKDLVLATGKLLFREMCENRELQNEPSTLKLADLTITYFGVNDLLQLLDEIFIAQTYYFITESAKPFIVDCGSNIGLSIIYFKKLYPNAEIIGFEPHPQTFAVLEKNLKANNISDVTLVQKALAASEKTVNFFVEHPGQLGMTMYATHPVARRVNKLGATPSDLSEQSVRLSQFITKPVDFLKMDIEGGEVEVLEELDQSKKLPLIKQMIFEFHNCVFSDSEILFNILSILRNNSFEFRIFDLVYNYKKADRNGPAAMIIYAYQK